MQLNYLTLDLFKQFNKKNKTVIMPAHKKDTSILTKYRVLYESGKISQMKLSQETNIGKVKIAEFIKENNWNTRLALQNQKKIYKENFYHKRQLKIILDFLKL